MKTSRLLKIRTALILLLFVPVVHAMDLGDEEALLSIYGDEQIISLAAGYLQPLSKAPSVASVITSDDIKRIGATNLDEVLQFVPGLHVSRDSIGYNPLYTFRGVYASFNPQVLMLVNNVPQTNLFHGDRSLVWVNFPVESIDRVEIIRGPGSALFGADAFAGVINIITKNASSHKVNEVGYRAGQHDTHEVWANYAGEYLGGDVFLSLVLGESDITDRKVREDAQSFLDQITGTHASLAPGRVNLARKYYDFRTEYNYNKLSLRLSHQYREGKNGVGVSQALDPNNVFVSHRTNLQFVYEEPELFRNLSLRVDASLFRTTQEVDEDLVLYPAGSTGGLEFGPLERGLISNPEVFERHSRLNISSIYTGLARHNISWGLGYYHGNLYRVREKKNFGFISDDEFLIPGGDPEYVIDSRYLFLRPGSRENHFVYLQDTWLFSSDWELTAGIRYDHYSDFGSTTNPRMALVWSTTRNLTTKVLYGEAFRAPSFAETRSINNPVALGNRSLKPETIRSYELAFDYRPSTQLNVLFNVFYYRWRDIIDYLPDSDGTTRTAQNFGDQQGRGFELEASYRVTPDWTLSGNFSYVDAEDKHSGAEAANFPGQQLYLRSFWQLTPQWGLNLQANHVMDRRRAENDPRSSIDDYTLVDVSLRYRITPRIEAAFLAKNLFNEDAREPTVISGPVPLIPNDLPLPGRTLLGELRLSF